MTHVKALKYRISRCLRAFSYFSVDTDSSTAYNYTDAIESNETLLYSFMQITVIRKVVKKI